MLPKALTKNLDRGRLRKLLALLFLALALPTAMLIWQAYGQLKWEAFHQHRGAAEELTRRINTRVVNMIRSADARSFADYTFLVVSGDPSANFVQRSPLSAYPVVEDLPGAMGYFQVDTAGTFSTPLLPSVGTAAVSLGISAAELDQRQLLARQIQAVLADNRLVQARADFELRRGLQQLESTPEPLADELAAPPESDADGVFRERSAAVDKDSVDRLAAAPSDQFPATSEGYSQRIFDQLNRPRADAPATAGNAGRPELEDATDATSATETRQNLGAKVSELKLDAALQKKSEEVEGEAVKEQSSIGIFGEIGGRAKRREKIALPETVPVDGNEVPANVATSTDLRISTFESEIDPFEFSLLDSGHFVLFRKVWRDGERYIQGLLVDQEAFTRDIIGARFLETSLANMSSLIVAYQDDVIHTFNGRDVSGYPNFAEDLESSLLYRSRLTAPLSSVELIFSINRLAPGPGASVLSWVTLILAVVFVGGFSVLYRLGASQIDLARQQQDFVSAVSHELKTPLTSIRMYGEMLKEGWADDEKRQAYYEFIHDESERLSRLISNVLELARITRNEPQFDLQPVAVSELMSNIESKISSQVERAGFELRFRRTESADNATIIVDQDCFTQIIINLVDNAIKFSKSAEKREIEIGNKLTSDNRIVFWVRDYGPGIPRDQMQKIFELFYRTESELTRETIGTGIGLAIVHQLMLAMHGKVDMVNAEPGAEFRLQFPSAVTAK